MCGSTVTAHTAPELVITSTGAEILSFFRISADPRRGTSVARFGPTGDERDKGVDVATEDRGFASMDRDKQKEIASKGGKAAHQKGTAHEWTSEEARDAGRKGGLASHRRRREQRDSGAAQEMVAVESGSFSTGIADQVN